MHCITVVAKSGLIRGRLESQADGAGISALTVKCGKMTLQAGQFGAELPLLVRSAACLIERVAMLSVGGSDFVSVAEPPELSVCSLVLEPPNVDCHVFST